jgi:hypothetical protein
VKIVYGILIFIFLFPVCLIAGVFGGCLIGAFAGSMDSSGSLIVITMSSGALIGIGSAVALTVLAVRSMRSV